MLAVSLFLDNASNPLSCGHRFCHGPADGSIVERDQPYGLTIFLLEVHRTAPSILKLRRLSEALASRLGIVGKGLVLGVRVHGKMGISRIG